MITLRQKLVASDILLVLCLVFPIIFYASSTSQQVLKLRENLAQTEEVNQSFIELNNIKRRIEALLFRLQYSREGGRAESVIEASEEFRSIILRFRDLETGDRLLAGFVDRYSDAELKIIASYLEIAALELGGKSSQIWPIRNQLTLLEPVAGVYKMDLSHYLSNLIVEYTHEMESRRNFFLRLALFSILACLMIVVLRYRFIQRNVVRPLGTLARGLKRIRAGRQLVMLPENPESPELNELVLSFNEMGQGLEQNRQYREIFSAITAHDLKEPLGAILSLVRLRELEIGDEKSETLDEELNFLKRLELNSTIGLNMIDALLQLSRSSFREISYEEIDLDKLIHKTFADISVLHFNRKSELVLSGKLGMMYGDLRQVETLFRNLISNSIKFGQAQRASVRIEFWGSDRFHEGRAFKNIHLRDDGVGFETSHYEKLLRPFEQASSETPKNESELHFMRGVGLGLAVCYRILDNHRGFFSATSQVGVGSEFVLSFPVLGAEVLTEARQVPAGRLY